MIQHNVIKFATGRFFSPGTPVSSTNKTDRHNITDILVKAALNTIKHKQNYNTNGMCRKIIMSKHLLS